MSKKVALMCGHGRSSDGSWDPGTAYGGNNEAALMLPITKAAVKYLRSYGVTVLTDADANNNKNIIADVAWSNKWGADIYVSVHCDYPPAPSGVMPLYVSAKGKKLATDLNNAIKSGMKMKSRGVVKRTNLYELNRTDCPACILETGSIKADISILKGKPDQYGKCIAKGICDYLGVKIPSSTAPGKPKPAPTPVLYRVRKSWNDAKSQAGAFKDLNNAKKLADQKGLNVYDNKGKLVYKGKKKTATNADKIVSKAKLYAWPYKTPAKKWAYSTGSALASYKAALKKQMKKTKKIDQSDCGYFVTTCVRSAGVSSSFLALKGNKDPFPPVPDNMAIVHKGKKIPDGFLKPGDIVRYKKKGGSQHALLILPGGKIAEAGRKIRFPIIRKDTRKYNASNVKLNTLQVIRAK